MLIVSERVDNRQMFRVDTTCLAYTRRLPLQAVHANGEEGVHAEGTVAFFTEKMFN